MGIYCTQSASGHCQLTAPCKVRCGDEGRPSSSESVQQCACDLTIFDPGTDPDCPVHTAPSSPGDKLERNPVHYQRDVKLLQERIDQLERELATLQQLYGAACLQLQARGDKEVSLVSATPAMGFTHAQAVCILKVRDALLAKDIEEAYHWLYTLDSKQVPHDPFKPWAELEAIATADRTESDKGQG